MAQAYV